MKGDSTIMLEALKNRMLLDESKKLSENAVSILCEEYELDEDIESIVLENTEVDEDDPDIDEIDRMLEEIEEDEDENITYEGLAAEDAVINKFVNDDAPSSVEDDDLTNADIDEE